MGATYFNGTVTTVSDNVYDTVKTIEIPLSEMADRSGWFKLLEEALKSKSVHLLNALFGSDVGDKEEVNVTAYIDDQTGVMVFSLNKQYYQDKSASSLFSLDELKMR